MLDEATSSLAQSLIVYQIWKGSFWCLMQDIIAHNKFKEGCQMFNKSHYFCRKHFEDSFCDDSLLAIPSASQGRVRMKLRNQSWYVTKPISMAPTLLWAWLTPQQEIIMIPVQLSSLTSKDVSLHQLGLLVIVICTWSKQFQKLSRVSAKIYKQPPQTPPHFSLLF